MNEPTTKKKNAGSSPEARAKAVATRKKEQARIAANVAASKRSTDIPLENIPERVTRAVYTDALKLKAVERVQAGETIEAVAASLGIPGPSVISTWRRRVEAGLPVTNRPSGPRAPGVQDDAAAMLRSAVAGAAKARDERLDAAAYIIENDIGGHEATALAKKIRSFKRTT